MTEKQLGLLPLRFVSHLSLHDEHATVYANEEMRISICIHVPFTDGGYGSSVSSPDPHRKPYTHYMYKGKVYECKKDFLQAIKDVPLMYIHR